jgi:hypothetical protein
MARPAAIAPTSTFTGMAFDTCTAPSGSTMNSWLASPYRAVGIYFGGSNRGCGQANLSSSWISSVQSIGWGLIPIYFGLQAPCVIQPAPPRAPLTTFAASQASAQGTASADDAVLQANSLGLSAGAPLYYDMEAYSSSVAGCTPSVMAFVSAWTSELHRLGYKSGAYGSTGSLMVDMSLSVGSPGFVPPDNVWFAHWNQLQTTSDSSSFPSFQDMYWGNHQRMHQYSGNISQQWGGVSINTDADWVDGAVAGTAVPVDYGANVTGPGGSGFVFTGSMAYWRPSGAPVGAKWLAYWTYSNGSSEANGATWSPQLPPGQYNVQANIPSTNATANAPYTITDALGTTTKVVNQQTNKGYTTLGIYTARAGGSISVHVGDSDPSSTTTQISVDAMAFLLVGTAPSAPEGVSAVAGDGQAVVSWTAAAANGSPITGYRVSASPGGATADVGGTTTSTVMSGLTNGTSYTFTVTASNVVGTSPASLPSAPVTPQEAVPAGGFIGATPARVLDTRLGLGAPQGKLGAGQTMTLTVPGLPAGTSAVALNVTVTGPTAASFLTVYRGGQNRPSLGSNLNYVPGQTIPNMVVVPLGPGNTVKIYNNAGTVDVIADVLGSFVPGAGDGFTGTNPTRVLDTRLGLGAPQGKLGAGQTMTLTVPGLPAGTSAVALNVTVTGPTAASFLTVYPGDQDRPTASNLNYVPGQSIPNMVLARLGPGNTVKIYNAAGIVDVIADVLGSFAPGAGNAFTGTTLARVLDTRIGLGAPQAKLGAGQTMTLTVPGLPAGTTAVALNVTVTGPNAASFLTVYPSDQDRPTASNLNYVPGQSIPNMVLARLGPGNTVKIYNAAGTVDVIADVLGYFAQVSDTSSAP